MNTTPATTPPAPPDFLTAAGHRLEIRRWSPSFADAPADAPTIVLLHEGLGSAGSWRDLPQALADDTGCGVLACSRPGYGASDPFPPPWPGDYLERHATEVLPALIEAANLSRLVLVGHSDGATIAACHLGLVDDPRVLGAVLIAPHFFVETEFQGALEATRAAFEQGDLGRRLARHHRDARAMFQGWIGVWTDPRFHGWNIEHLIGRIRVPVLAIQGRQDQYASLAQIRALDAMPTPPEVAILDDCRHHPHLEQPATTRRLIAGFVNRLIPDHKPRQPSSTA